MQFTLLATEDIVAKTRLSGACTGLRQLRLKALPSLCGLAPAGTVHETRPCWRSRLFDVSIPAVVSLDDFAFGY